MRGRATRTPASRRRSRSCAASRRSIRTTSRSWRVPSAAVQNYLVTQDGVSNDIVYGMTKALWTNLDALVAAHSAAKAIDAKRALEGMPIPLHPGAEKYYKEAGMLK